MDLNFYHFTEPPFPATPASATQFLSASQQHAWQTLHAGVTKQQGLVALTGVVGLGKTTVLRTYLAHLNPQQYTTLFLPAAAFSLQAILARLCQIYQCAYDPENLHISADRLRHALLPDNHRGRRTILVIDDAHTLDVQTLWNLRMLSDLMRTPAGYLIQIVLTGRPEFHNLLDLPELQQLKQRLTVQAELASLTRQESLAYIHHRLAQVTTQDAPVFTRQALKHVVMYAHGNPQHLNRFCAAILTLGAVYQQRPIPAKTAREVLTRLTSPVRHTYTRVACAVGFVLSLGLLWFGPWNLAQSLQRLVPLGPWPRIETLARFRQRAADQPVQPFQVTATAPTSPSVSSGSPPRLTATPALQHVDFRKLIGVSPISSTGEPTTLTLVTRNTFLPFTGDTLPHQGMLNDIVRTAFTAMGYHMTTEFRDWPSALTATEKLQFTGIFPYDSTQKQLPHFFYSKPLYSGSIRAFMPAEHPLPAVTPEALRGMTWCGSETLWPPADLPLARQPHPSLPLAPTLETCFTLLLQAQVELVVADELHGYAVLHTMGITDRIRMLDNPLGSHTLHLLLPKFASRSHALMYEFDQSLALLEKAGILNEITTRHRQPYSGAIPFVPAPLQQAERQP